MPAYQFLKHSHVIHCHSNATALASGHVLCYKQPPDKQESYSLVSLF